MLFRSSGGYGNGVVDLAGVPDSIVMIGSHNGIPANTDYEATSVEDGHVMLDWSYTSDDDPGMDSFGYLLNGVYSLLADHESGGFTQFNLAAGDRFGFRLASLDAQHAPGVLTIHFFSAPGDPEPEPSVPAPCAWLGLGAAYGFSRRLRRRRAAS